MEPSERIPVLIVDDLPENLTSLEALLADDELDLVQALSGNEALRQTLYTDFALVLLDVQMPEMNGFETAELMRQNPKTRHLPIIFVTAGMSEDYHRFKGYEAGAVDYLTKPIEPAVLKSKVRVFCDLFVQRRELRRVQAELEMQHAKLQEETTQRLKALEDLRQKDQMMIQQSRLAAMGEMLNNIAHQWRQPLNVLGLTLQELGICFEEGECTKDYLDDQIEKSMDILKHLSQTIDAFRDFSSPEKEKVRFSVEQNIAKTLSMVEGSFQQRGISIDFTSEGDPHINGYPNEFRQVLLNILMNAKDAFDGTQDDANIRVRSWTEDGRATVTITDNAGGIKDDIIGKIFDAYFTTKELGKGTGVGLFMSKMIVERSMGGRLTVRNVEGGAEFRVEV